MRRVYHLHGDYSIIVGVSYQGLRSPYVEIINMQPSLAQQPHYLPVSFVCCHVRAQINEELAKSNFDFFIEFNLICI